MSRYSTFKENENLSSLFFSSLKIKEDHLYYLMNSKGLGNTTLRRLRVPLDIFIRRFFV